MQALTVNKKNTYTGSDVSFIGDECLHFLYFFQYSHYSYSNDSIKGDYLFLKDKELTNFCMAISENSLKEGWDNEDDSRWESFENEIQ